MLQDLLVPLIAVGLAELGDKTQLSVLLLSSKTKKHTHLLLGVMLAFFLVDGAAILAGSLISGALPLDTIRLVSGAIFIFFGVMTLRENTEKCEEEVSIKNPFLSGFTMIFAAELGDKTQITAGLFAAKYDAIMVLAGTMIALAALSITAIYLGKIVLAKLDKRTISKIAGILFILIGMSFFLI